MKIDMDLKPIGREQMMQRLQEMQAQTTSAPSFSLPPTGNSGLSGNLPEINGNLPFDPKGLGITLKADEAPPNLRALIQKAAGENGVDPALLDAVVACESSYDPNCRSRAGALGLTQLMPDTMKEVGVSDWRDPEQNLQGGAKYLSKMLDKYPGRMDLALAAYNAGPGTVAKHGGIPPYTETQNYVNKVLSLYNARKDRP